MEYEISINGIVVIDFLADGEYRTGDSLFSTYISSAPWAFERRLYFHASTKQRFFEVAAEVLNEVKTKGLRPIFHIESHGSEVGINCSPAGREFISWVELKPLLQAMNRYSGFNLLVVMSACRGSYLMSAVTTTDPAPAWGFIGPKDNLSPYELLEDYGRFYRHFFSGSEIIKSIQVLNQKELGQQEKYQVATAEFFFHAIWGRYLATEGSKADLQRRVTRLMSRSTSVHGAGKRAVGRMREKLLAGIGDHTAIFQDLKRIYFMEDSFPGMADRFGVSSEMAMTYFRLERPSAEVDKHPRTLAGA